MKLKILYGLAIINFLLLVVSGFLLYQSMFNPENSLTSMPFSLLPVPIVAMNMVFVGLSIDKEKKKQKEVEELIRKL